MYIQMKTNIDMPIHLGNVMFGELGCKVHSLHMYSIYLSTYQVLLDSQLAVQVLEVCSALVDVSLLPLQLSVQYHLYRCMRKVDNYSTVLIWA